MIEYIERKLILLVRLFNGSGAWMHKLEIALLLSKETSLLKALRSFQLITLITVMK